MQKKVELSKTRDLTMAAVVEEINQQVSRKKIQRLAQDGDGVVIELVTGETLRFAVVSGKVAVTFKPNE